MGLAEQTIARAQKLKAESDKQNSLTLAAVEAAQTGAPLLWNDLRDYIQREVGELAEKLPAAEFLRSDRFNENNLTVQTTVLPLVKLEVLRCGMYLTASYTETLRGLSEPVQRSLGRFRFTVDGTLQPCFAAECGALHPQQVGDRVLKPVCDFLIRNPPLVSCFW
jgi:hypothetical protein